MEIERAWHSHVLGLLLAMIGALGFVGGLGVGIGTTLIAFGLIYWAGRGDEKIVPVGYKAVMLFLGERTEIILPEGRNWTPPFVTSLMSESIQKRSMIVEVGDVLTKNQGRTRAGKGGTGTPTNITVVAEVQVADVWQTFGTANLFGNWSRESGTVSTGLVFAAIEVATRAFATALTFDEVAGYKGQGPNGLVDPVRTDLTAWGVHLVSLKIKDVRPPPQLADALATRETERVQRSSEMIQIEAYRDQAAKLVKESKGKDGKPRLSFERAFELVLVANSKARGHVIRGGKVGDFATGAAVGQQP